MRGGDSYHSTQGGTMSDTWCKDAVHFLERGLHESHAPRALPISLHHTKRSSNWSSGQ